MCKRRKLIIAKITVSDELIETPVTFCLMTPEDISGCS
jgi:hypothetical protein